MNDFGSTLIAHCGARKITRGELMDIPVPEATRTHQPLAHYEIVKVLEEALSFRYLKVVKDEYAVSRDGMKMFGVMDLSYEFSGCRFSIGLRNSNDKSMRLALTVGYRVYVCDNMTFSGDFTPLLQKHTRKLELKDSISIAVDRIHRGFEPLKAQVEAMREQVLAEDEAKLIIYQAFLDRNVKGVPRHLMPIVHNLYFRPQLEAFIPRNLWSLSNAFTSAFKKLGPVKQFEATARFGSYLSDVQRGLKLKRQLDTRFERQLEGKQIGEATLQPVKVLQMPQLAGANNPNLSISAGSNFGSNSINQNRQPNNLGYEDFDEDDVAEDPYDELDDYFDEEEESEATDEAIVEM
ncbi:MAG: hypothetical protein LC768_08030, partial [Acidobacteria bacterium]|nr:hypothetical protein [Acidobacteriota bacterium]